MLVSNPEFIEDSEYGYSVGRIRAIETKLVRSAGYTTLLSAPPERFYPLFTEITGIRGEADVDLNGFLRLLEETFTEQFFMVKSLILDDEIKRLISLEYDYELLKLIVKEGWIGRTESLSVPMEVSKRSNHSYPVLKSLLEGGKFMDTGEILFETYVSLRDRKELSGNIIDNSCEDAYYRELFGIVEEYRNPFLTGYFTRKVDMRNVLTALRLRVRGGKKADLRTRYLPYGTIDIGYLEQSLDLNIEVFASRIIFSPIGVILKGVEKKGEETEQIAQAERLIEEDLLRYIRESIFVTFGVEPVLSYLWEKEIETKNLRTILLGKMTGIAPEEIRRHVRGLYG